MITVAEADRLLTQHVFNLSAETVTLSRALGRVLHKNILADRDFPPFDRVAMDGIAIKYPVIESGKRQFQIEGIQPSGAPAKTLNHDDRCLEVMTGAVLPQGCDCVIPYEKVQIESGYAAVEESFETGLWKNVHKQGSDLKAGNIILHAGIRLHGPALAAASSVGKTSLSVSTTPLVALLSTGDELVDPAEIPQPYQIRASNLPAIAASLEVHGMAGTCLRLPDDKEILNSEISRAFENHDVIILTGGVSKGKFDYIPELLKKNSVEQVFHKIYQRPGKPLWFGVRLKKGRKQAVFGLPGNPVSALICYQRYVVPFLRACAGEYRIPVNKLRLAQKIESKPGFTRFVPVRLDSNALTIVSNGSGDLVSLSQSDGFVEVSDRPGEPNDVFEFYSWESHP